MSTAPETRAAPPRYVTRDLCETIHGEQREANARTWEEIRTLRRLVITLVVGGQLIAGGAHLAGLRYWLDQYVAQPRAATVQMVAEARAEAREDLKELRREFLNLLRPAAGARPTSPEQPNEGDVR
ncbi:MAG: hypothetical protein IMZ66_10000 [Planctomycetes bacterium]|nr:hypothetical protein [Planctomycetota bacterium]